MQLGQLEQRVLMENMDQRGLMDQEYDNSIIIYCFRDIIIHLNFLFRVPQDHQDLQDLRDHLVIRYYSFKFIPH